MNPEPFRVAGEIFGHLLIMLKSGNVIMINSGMTHTCCGGAGIQFDWEVKVRGRLFRFSATFSLIELQFKVSAERSAQLLADRWNFELNKLVKELKERNRS